MHPQIPRAEARGHPACRSTQAKTTGEADHAGLPRAMFGSLYVLSPVSGVFCHRCLQDTSRKIDATVAAPGPHDFAVRCRRYVQRANPPDAAASIASHAQRIVTIMMRPSDGLGVKAM